MRTLHDLIKDVGFQPNTSIEEGLDKFVGWYKTITINFSIAVFSELMLGLIRVC